MAGEDDRTINGIITSANSSGASALPLLQFEKRCLTGGSSSERRRHERGLNIALHYTFPR